LTGHAEDANVCDATIEGHGAAEQERGRLDDLNRKVDASIGRLDEERKELRGEMREEFKLVRSEMRERFDKVDDEFKAVCSEMKEGLEKFGERFDRLQWNLLAGAIAIIAALIASPHL
jgi:hypothetical protein